MAKSNWTHDELIGRAERWLRYSAQMPAGYTLANGHQAMERCYCAVVLTEPALGCGSEEPDAIGWFAGGNWSILIECKASRADFLADRKKWIRRKGVQRLGLGQYRYYMAPRGLLNIDELPDGWGLLGVEGRRVYVARHSERHEHDVRRELGILWSECRKIQFVDRGGELVSTKAGRRITRALELFGKD